MSQLNSVCSSTSSIRSISPRRNAEASQRLRPTLISIFKFGYVDLDKARYSGNSVSMASAHAPILTCVSIPPVPLPCRPRRSFSVKALHTPEAGRLVS